jgi:hypothetical protein
MNFRSVGMKMVKFSKILSLLILISFVASVGYTQSSGVTGESQKNPDGTYSSSKFDEAQRPEDSYLARFHAQDVVYKLMKQNLEQIYTLKVIAENFSDKGWKGDYDKVYSGYKRAMELYYKRNLVYARVEFESNRKDINDLLVKMIQEYKAQVQEMLNECADKVLILHLDATTRNDPNKSDALFTNQLRLQVAYGQFDDAIQAEIHHYNYGAIGHYRSAKAYAIAILEALAKPDEQSSVAEKYKVHKADILNRIYNISKSSGSSEAKAEKK